MTIGYQTKLAGRPVLKHEEEVVMTNLAKTSLRGPKPRHTDLCQNKIFLPGQDMVRLRAERCPSSYCGGSWMDGYRGGLTTMRSVQTMEKSSAAESQNLSRRYSDARNTSWY